MPNEHYSVACWRGGWVVYKDDERRCPVAHGFATKQSAEAWIASQPAAPTAA